MRGFEYDAIPAPLRARAIRADKEVADLVSQVVFRMGSLAAAEEATGFGRASIGAWARGDRRPNVSTLAAFLAASGYKLDLAVRPAEPGGEGSGLVAVSASATHLASLARMADQLASGIRRYGLG